MLNYQRVPSGQLTVCYGKSPKNSRFFEVLETRAKEMHHAERRPLQMEPVEAARAARGSGAKKQDFAPKKKRRSRADNMAIFGNII